MQYGVCYRFNSGRNMIGKRTEILKQSRVGIDFGINLGLNVTSENELDQAKIYVYIHENSLATFNPRVYVPTSPGSIHYFKLNKTIRKKLNSPPSNQCISTLKQSEKFNGNRTLVDYLLITLNKSYSKNFTSFYSF